MPDFSYAYGDQPALDEVTRADLILDALAERQDVDLGDPQDDVLAALLGDWRDNLRWPPASALVSQREAIQALHTGIAERRSTRRSLAAVGSVAATLLLLSGLGAVVADARPGDLLYGLHAMMFDEPRVNDEKILLSAKADLAKVEQMIAQGQWTAAQDQLAEVSNTLQGVNDGNRRRNLMDEVDQLNTKVERRDPNATLPPKPEAVAPPGSAGNVRAPLVPQAPAPAADVPQVPVLTNPFASSTSVSPSTTDPDAISPTPSLSSSGSRISP